MQTNSLIFTKVKVKYDFMLGVSGYVIASLQKTHCIFIIKKRKRARLPQLSQNLECTELRIKWGTISVLGILFLLHSILHLEFLSISNK